MAVYVNIKVNLDSLKSKFSNYKRDLNFLRVIGPNPNVKYPISKYNRNPNLTVRDTLSFHVDKWDVVTPTGDIMGVSAREEIDKALRAERTKGIGDVIGKLGVAVFAQEITTIRNPPNSWSWVKEKGFDDPLIHTKRLRNNIISTNKMIF